MRRGLSRARARTAGLTRGRRDVAPSTPARPGAGVSGAGLVDLGGDPSTRCLSHGRGQDPAVTISLSTSTAAMRLSAFACRRCNIWRSTSTCSSRRSSTLAADSSQCAKVALAWSTRLASTLGSFLNSSNSSVALCAASLRALTSMYATSVRSSPSGSGRIPSTFRCHRPYHGRCALRAASMRRPPSSTSSISSSISCIRVRVAIGGRRPASLRLWYVSRSMYSPRRVRTSTSSCGPRCERSS